MEKMVVEGAVRVFATDCQVGMLRVAHYKLIAGTGHGTVEVPGGKIGK